MKRKLKSPLKNSHPPEMADDCFKEAKFIGIIPALILWSLPKILIVVDLNRTVIEFAYFVRFGTLEIIGELFVGSQDIY